MADLVIRTEVVAKSDSNDETEELSDELAELLTEFDAEILGDTLLDDDVHRVSVRDDIGRIVLVNIL